MFLLNKVKLTIIVLTIIGALLHFYNLSWGAPFHFHPDERNIASSVSQLSYPNQLNPNFFAYGSLPIYTIFGTGLLANTLFGNDVLQNNNGVSFEQAIFISRFYSALFATLLIPMLFVLGKKLFSEKAGLVTAFFVTFSTGVIQFAHFGTFELWITFFSVLLLWQCLELCKKGSMRHILYLGVILGILFATKVSTIVLAPIPLLAIILTSKKYKKIHRKILFICSSSLFLLAIATCLYLISNPFVFIDRPSFENSIQYESQVGLGALPVFYTGGFFDTIPVIYQLLHIYPFLINPILTILIVPALLFTAWYGYRQKQQMYIVLFGILLILFFSQALLFIKWTRNMIPTLPYLYLCIAFFVTHDWGKQSWHRRLQEITIVITLSCAIIFSLSYFITVYTNEDTRITATTYAQSNISPTATILSEPYDLGLMPFNPYFSNIVISNIYDLDTDTSNLTKLSVQNTLDMSDYILLPSQRVIQTRMQNPERFPEGNRFYKDLVSEKDFKLIYQTPCDIFCKIAYLGEPTYYWEQTATVFDRPTIYIFEKRK